MLTNKNIKNVGSALLITSFFLFALAPIATVSAQEVSSGPVTGVMCGVSFVCSSDGSDACKDPSKAVPCEGFGLLIQAIKGIANFAVGLGLAFSVVVIAYSGAEYMIYSDNESKRKQANERFQKVAIGIFWVLAAWLVVNMIMTALASSGVTQFLSNS
jgi:hypothetical protein